MVPQCQLYNYKLYKEIVKTEQIYQSGILKIVYVALQEGKKEKTEKQKRFLAGVAQLVGNHPMH